MAAYINRGRQAVKDGEFELADRYFHQVLAQFPSNEEALDGLESIEVERARRKSTPVGWWLKYLSGTLALLAGRTEPAYKSFKFIHRVKPDHAGAAFALARCAEKLNHAEEACELYQAVLKLKPTHQPALRACAETLVQLGEHERAAEMLQRLHALRPGDDKIEHRLRDVAALAYARVGVPEDLKARRRAMEKEKLDALDNEEFMEKLDKMLAAYKASPDNHGIGVDVAAHYISGGHLKQAEKVLGLILDKNPHFEPAQREQARLWRRTGDLEICLGLYKDLVRVHPEDAGLRDEYLEAEIAHMNELKNSGKLTPEQFRRLETLKVEREKTRIEVLEGVMRMHPERHLERAELGELLLKHGRLDEAITALQRLIHEPSWAGKGFFLLGQCFRARRDLPLAIQQYEKSLEFFKNKGYSHVPTPELKEAYYYLGLAREESGDKAGAREAYGAIYSYDINYRDVKKRYEGSA